MDSDIQAKRDELLRTLYEIEQKMTSLDARGLSLALFDQSKASGLLDEMRKDCQQESAKCMLDITQWRLSYRERMTRLPKIRT